MTKKKKIVIGSVAGVLVLAVAGVAIASGGERTVEVRTETVETRDLIATVTANGKIQPKRRVEISADISGRVVEVAVEEGQMVQQGDLLLRIDPTSFQAAVRRQEAAVAQARSQVAQANANVLQSRSARDRADRLSGQDNLVSAADLEQAHTNLAVAEAQHEAARYGVAQAEAALSEAREQLRKTRISSPMTGRVTRLNIEEGETAVVGTMNNPGSLLLTVADLGVMEARVTVDETDVPRMTFGDSATVRIDAFPEEVFTGRVTRIANSATNGQAGQGQQGSGQSVDFEVVITLDDPPADLRPDLSATAEIITARRDGVLAVPIISLTLREPPEELPEAAGGGDGEAEGVFVVRDGRARFVPVRIGITGDRHFEILSGLEGGETVVSGSYQAIRDLDDGTPVRTAGAAARSRDGS